MKLLVVIILLWSSHAFSDDPQAICQAKHKVLKNTCHKTEDIAATMEAKTDFAYFYEGCRGQSTVSMSYSSTFTKGNPPYWSCTITTTGKKKSTLEVITDLDTSYTATTEGKTLKRTIKTRDGKVECVSSVEASDANDSHAGKPRVELALLSCHAVLSPDSRLRRLRPLKDQDLSDLLVNKKSVKDLLKDKHLPTTIFKNGKPYPDIVQ